MKTLANPSQRFVAFLIDTIIIGFVTFLLSLLLLVVFRVKEPQFEKIDPHVKPVLVEMINNKLSPTGNSNLTTDINDEQVALYVYYLVDDETVKNTCARYDSDFSSMVINSVEDCRSYASASMKYTLTSSIVSFLSYLIIIVLYYDILGYYWSKQTVGRMLMKIKVESLEGKDPTMGTLVLRDLVGFGLYNILNICCFIALIINIIYITRDNISVGDRLSSTRMVRYDEAALNQENGNEYSPYMSSHLYENNSRFNTNKEEIKDAEIVDDDSDDENNLNDSDDDE